MSASDARMVFFIIQNKVNFFISKLHLRLLLIPSTLAFQTHDPGVMEEAEVIHTLEDGRLV